MKKVTLDVGLLRATDFKFLSTLVNLTELRFQGGGHPHQTGQLVSQVVVSASALLEHLKIIRVLHVPQGFQVLRSISGLEDLARRLEVLVILDPRHAFDDDDLWALCSLTALRTLCLGYESFQCSALAAEDLSEQLSLLPQELQITTNDLEEQPGLRVFPGSLTALTSLNFCVEGDDDDCLLQTRSTHTSGSWPTQLATSPAFAASAAMPACLPRRGRGRCWAR